jgi:hypothetical protein
MKKLLVLMFFFTTALAVFAQQQGVIRTLTGTVELKPAGAAAFVPAKAGDRVAMNTLISTGFKSTAIVVVGSTTLTVRALTRLTLTEISQSQEIERLDMNLQTGRVRVEVRPPVGTRANTTVRSPTATASVRGTEFEIDTYTLTVLDGTVAYSGKDGRVMLVRSGDTSHTYSVNGSAADPIETEAASLLPPAPVGTDESDSPRNEGGAGGVELSFVFEF